MEDETDNKKDGIVPNQQTNIDFPEKISITIENPFSIGLWFGVGWFFSSLFIALIIMLFFSLGLGVTELNLSNIP